ncbi:MAG TPA: 2-oxo-hepta-3-ene-1,7-dioic acid hydratase [Roseiarcus sp.]|nr:2-oxo-hepta-3-ene-1,7-dioic acid hydratase [Roseiarcus sp.]
MGPDDHIAAAKRLDAAERERKQIRMLTLDHPAMTMADSYAIQKAWLDIKLKRGGRIVGHKIGLTSKAMQAAVGVKEPDSGFLLDDMVFADGGEIPSGRFIGLRVEAELAFVLGKPLAGPNCTASDAVAASDFVSPALELLDTRIFRVDPETGKTRTVRDTIADNAANAGLILGGRRFRPFDHDLRWIGAICAKNGEVEETGLAAGVLNNPATGIAWLANRLAENGERLEAGEIVLAGSFIRPIEVGRGDRIHADFGAFGAVSCHFG